MLWLFHSFSRLANTRRRKAVRAWNPYFLVFANRRRRLERLGFSSCLVCTAEKGGLGVGGGDWERDGGQSTCDTHAAVLMGG